MMFQQRSSSSLLTILLILVAAFSTPDAVSAQTRKLRKDGDSSNRERRLNTKSSKDSACHKSTKAGCIGFVFSLIPVEEKGVGAEDYSHLSYGNGRDGDGTCGGNSCDGWFWTGGGAGGRVATKAVAVGTTVYQYGQIGKEPTDGGPFTFTDPDYYFHQQCTVVRGRMNPNNGRFMVNNFGDQEFDNNVPLKCDIFIHNGRGYSGFEDLPDTIHLRGYTEGTIDARQAPTEANLADEGLEVEELYRVKDFVATVLGGTGRWAGSIGMAEVLTEGRWGKDIDEILPIDLPSGWLIDLYATVSPAYDKAYNLIELPPKLEFEPEVLIDGEVLAF